MQRAALGAACGPLIIVALALLAAPAHAQSRRVAVLDFANTAKDSTVEWLGPAVAETITTKLHAIRTLQLVERLQLYKLLQEQRLNLADLVDPSQAIKVGKLLGAEQVVLGGYAVFGGTVRFTARFVDVATGAIVATSQVNGVLDPRNPNGLWTAFDQLAQAAIDSLNTRVAVVQGLPQAVLVAPSQRIDPSPEEKARFARAPTKSIEAQEAFGRGLAAQKRGHLAEAAREIERATLLDPEYVAAWVALGNVFDDLRDWPRALKASQAAHALYTRLGDDEGQAGTLNNIGLVRQKQGRYAEALGYCERGLELMRKLGNEPGQALLLDNIGTILRNQRRYREALSYHERSLRLAEKLGDELKQILVLDNIAAVHAAQGRYEEARSAYEVSLRKAEALSDDRHRSWVLQKLGALHHRQKRYGEALRFYEQSLKVAEGFGDETRLAAALNDIGVTYQAQGRYDEALSHYDRSLRLHQKLGDEATQADVLSNIGMVHALRGQYADGLRFLERRLHLMEKLDDAPEQARTLEVIGDVYTVANRYPEALASYRKSLGLLQKLGVQEPRQAAVLYQMGRIHEVERRYADALSMFQRAVEIGDRLTMGDGGKFRQALDRVRRQVR